MDVCVKFGYSMLNMGLIIRLTAGWSRFMHLHTVFNCSLQPTRSNLATSYPACVCDWLSLISVYNFLVITFVLNKFSQSCWMRHFRPFLNFDKCLSEVAGDVISCVAEDEVSKDVRAAFGEFGLYSCRIIWLFGRPDPFLASLLCSI